MLIDNELKTLIPPLTQEEYKGLEESILKDGVREQKREYALRSLHFYIKNLQEERGKTNIQCAEQIGCTAANYGYLLGQMRFSTLQLMIILNYLEADLSHFGPMLRIE